MNLIFGSAGFAKEVDWLITDIYNATGTDYRTNYFVAEEGNKLIGGKINSSEVIGEFDVFNLMLEKKVNCFIAVGSPNLKEIIVKKIKTMMPLCCFPNLIHPTVSYDMREGKLNLCEGNIICSNAVLTTDIKIWNFVHVNIACTIGHDSFIGDYSTISPGVHVSGNVKIEKNVFIGTGAVILEKLSICKGSVIGAGSTVTKSILIPGVYAGVPAKKMK